MRFPVKLNRAFWPDLLCRVLPAAFNTADLIDCPDDAERFSQAVSTLKFGTTFKTTASARYPKMIRELSRLRFDSPPAILDLAASDGTASLAVMDGVPHSRYCLTDRNPAVLWTCRGGRYYFHDPVTRECLLCVDRHAVCYADTAGALWPFGPLARHRLAQGAGAPVGDEQAIELVNPEVRRKHPALQLRRHDIFDAWSGEPVDIVIAANILNRNYFDEAQLRIAIRQALAALGGKGFLAVVDNRPGEHGSLFSLERERLSLVASLHGGAAVESLVREHQAR